MCTEWTVSDIQYCLIICIHRTTNSRRFNMDTSIFVVVLLGTVIVSFGVSSQEKRLLLSNPTPSANDIQQLQSMFSTLNTTLSAKIATLELDLTTTKSSLSSANSRLAPVSMHTLARCRQRIVLLAERWCWLHYVGPTLAQHTYSVVLVVGCTRW